MICSRCGKRPASKKPYKGQEPDGLCPNCRHYLKTAPGASTRPTAYGVRGMTLEERFWAKVDKGEPDECWPWLAGVDRDGYGKFVYDGSSKGAHRYSYYLEFGEFPPEDGHHTCENTLCVNPRHLVPLTKVEHLHVGTAPASLNAKKTHCKRGHEFTEANTILLYYPDGRLKGRNCRACKNANNLSRYHQNKGGGSKSAPDVQD